MSCAIQKKKTCDGAALPTIGPRPIDFVITTANPVQCFGLCRVRKNVVITYYKYGIQAYRLDGSLMYDLNDQPAIFLAVAAVGDILIKISQTAADVYDITSGDFNYRIPLPSLPDADNKRKILYSSEYKVVIAIRDVFITSYAQLHVSFGDNYGKQKFDFGLLD